MPELTFMYPAYRPLVLVFDPRAPGEGGSRSALTARPRGVFGIGQGLEPVRIEALPSQRGIEGFHVGIVRWLPGS